MARLLSVGNAMDAVDSIGIPDLEDEDPSQIVIKLLSKQTETKIDTGISKGVRYRTGHLQMP